MVLLFVPIKLKVRKRRRLKMTCPTCILCLFQHQVMFNVMFFRPLVISLPVTSFSNAGLHTFSVVWVSLYDAKLERKIVEYDSGI